MKMTTFKLCFGSCVVLLAAGASTSCIGREAGSGLTATSSGPDSVTEEPNTPANDADYPDIVDPKAAPGTASVSIAMDTRFQTLEGFGAAVGWMHDRIVGDTPKGLYELLFPQLGLDILRLRNRYNRKEQNDAHPEQDAEIWKRANEASGHQLKLLMTSWSPPAAIKANKAERCKGNNDCTLSKENGKFPYDKFADYWVKSLQEYASLGVVPEYITLQNELDFVPPNWEGCRFDPVETAEYPGYNVALEKVYATLHKSPNPPKILGPETLGIHYNKVQNYVRSMNQDLVYGVAHHLYEMGGDKIWDWRYPGPDSYVDEMLSVAQATRKPLFQTEFMTDDDKGIEGGFETAWLVHHTMAAEGAVAFVYWDLIWDGLQGLVGMRGKSPTIRDQYYSMKHFALYTDPGYVRVGANSDSKQVLASAYISPDEKRLTTVLLNTGKNTMDVKLEGGKSDATKVQAFRTVYRPGHSNRWEELKGLTPTSLIQMPARSVVTVVQEKL